MKKALALVLALVMVLALVPVAFAASENITISSDKYTVSAALAFDPNASAETYTSPFKDENKAVPAVKIEVPYSAITTATTEENIWNSTTAPEITLTVGNFGTTANVFTDNLSTSSNISKIYINGKDTEFGDSSAGKPITLNADKTLSFVMGALSKTNSVYEYEIKVVSTDDNTKIYTETMKFTVEFVNKDKPTYELKVVGASALTQKDGIWFMDTDKNAFATTTATSSDFELRKNDGSKFDTTAYYSIDVAAVDAAAYKKVDVAKKLTDNKTAVEELTASTAVPSDGDKKQVALRVETQYAFYETKLIVKYRTNVKAIDPKGIAFAQDEYTIKVNEVFKPTFKFVVEPLKDIQPVLSISAYGEKNIVDIDGANVIGLKEGVAYVTATYEETFDGVEKTYSDTAKFTVSGDIKIQPNDNFVVTVASGSCLIKRAAASTSAANLGKLKNGEVIQVVEVKDGWAKCLDAYKSNFYVSAAYITRQGTQQFNSKGIVIARCLNVRAGAGTTFAVKGHLYRNAEIAIKEVTADGAWGKIDYLGTDGFVSLKYIQ